MLQCVQARWSRVQPFCEVCEGCVAVCCCALQCVAVCVSMLQCVAVCCSVLQCVVAWCSMLQCVAVCSGKVEWSPAIP